jgi:hypothetical protein
VNGGKAGAAVIESTEQLAAALEESETLAASLLQPLAELALINDSGRIETAYAACSLSIEHWSSIRSLLAEAALSSALVVHRAQFEAATRSIWLTYAATDDNIAKFSQALSIESEQAAKNAPQVERMMEQIGLKAPKPAYEALQRFKTHSWRALNSYVHAGIHPLRRHQVGYPVALIHNVLCNANGLGVLSCMQAAVLGGEQPLQKYLLEVAGRFPQCLPSPL